MGVSKPLKDAFFDPSRGTLHWVHAAAEIVEAVELTMNIIATGAQGATALRVAHWLHRVDSVAATTGDIGVASGRLAHLLVPVAEGVPAVVAGFAAVGSGDAELADDEVEKAAVSGYTLGVVTGAMRERASMVERFMMKYPKTYDIVPALSPVVQNHRNAGLVRGYAEGRVLNNAQAQLLWTELAKNADRSLRFNGGGPDEDF